MEYVVVWSGEIEKRIHDQQVRPAPPIGDEYCRRAPRSKTRARRNMADAQFWQFLGKLFGKRTRKKVG